LIKSDPLNRITLKGLQFHAFHGLYPDERVHGNQFLVDVIIDTRFEQRSFEDDLTGTLDYVAIYKVIQEEMINPGLLLESVVQRMVTRIINEFPSSQKVEISLSKLNPPIGGECEQAIVTISEEKAS
jgi:dihydroneopterin aldolase